MNSENGHSLGEIIAYWNLEHTPDERNAHLVWARDFLKRSGLDRFMAARLVTGKPDGFWGLGWPQTQIDFRLRRKYLNRVYRHRGTGARIVGLSVFHVWFSHNAGVYDPDRHADEVSKLTGSCKSEADAERISKWKGWDGSVYEYRLRTDARHYAYRCRVCSGYDGDSGDSFKYGPDWADIHKRLEDVLYRIVDDLGLRYIK